MDVPSQTKSWEVVFSMSKIQYPKNPGTSNMPRTWGPRNTPAIQFHLPLHFSEVQSLILMESCGRIQVPKMQYAEDSKSSIL